MGEYSPFDDNADQTKKGWLTAILELGAWFGALSSSFIAEYLSRKIGIIVATSVFIVGVCVQTIAVSGSGPSATLAGRFITGWGVGSVSMIVPIVSFAAIRYPEDRTLMAIHSTPPRLRHRKMRLYSAIAARC